MFKNFFTTGMSANGKNLETRFRKIRSKRKVSLALSLICSLILIIVLALATVVMARFYSPEQDNVLEKSVSPLDFGITYPCSGYYNISSEFGTRTHPLTGKEITHNGIDIVVPEGAEVVAGIDGKVLTTGFTMSQGNYIILYNGNNTELLYAHLSEIIAAEGQEIKRGQIIGKAGSTGESTGAHLHFEVIIDGECVNPLDYFSQQTNIEFSDKIQTVIDSARWKEDNGYKSGAYSFRIKSINYNDEQTKAEVVAETWQYENSQQPDILTVNFEKVNGEWIFKDSSWELKSLSE